MADMALQRRAWALHLLQMSCITQGMSAFFRAKIAHPACSLQRLTSKRLTSALRVGMSGCAGWNTRLRAAAE
jgi:hypothetical protein